MGSLRTKSEKYSNKVIMPHCWLTVVQKTFIDSLHKEGQTRRVVVKERAYSSKHITRNFNGRKNMVVKDEQAKGITTALRGLWNKGPWPSPGHHLELTAVVSLNQGASEASHWGEDKRTGLLLSGPKFSLQIKLNIAFNLDGLSVLHCPANSEESVEFSEGETSDSTTQERLKTPLHCCCFLFVCLFVVQHLFIKKI